MIFTKIVMVIFQVTFQLTMIVISFQIIALTCNLKEKKVKKKVNTTKIIQITKFNVKNSKLTINEVIDINVRYRQII